MQITKILVLTIPLAILAGGWFYLNNSKQSTNQLPGTSEIESQTLSNTVVESVSENTILPEPTDEVPTEVITTDLLSDNTRTINDSVDTANIGLAPLSDEEYSALQSQLHNDSGLLLSLLEEFRYNTNPRRALQLAALLGEHNRSEVIDVAAELAFSGDPTSQTMGLDLLSRLQPNNDRARDIAIELLGSETNPELLVSTLNVLATPARKASEAQRQSLMENITLLSTHSDHNVRSHSVALIGRWNRDSGIETLKTALNDSHPQVRARATSALRGISNPDHELINGLLMIAENTEELKTTRQSALYSLQKMSLSGGAQIRYDQALTSVRSR